MKSILKKLLFDRELVNSIQAAEVKNEILYTQLISGRITLKEYLALSR